jgi:plasmid replication initiation protein
MAVASKKEQQADSKKTAVKAKQKTAHRTADELSALDWRDRTVNMSNALVSSAQALSLREKRVMALAVSKLDSMRHPGATPPKVRIEAAEYAALADIALNDAYKELAEATENLRKRTITFAHEWKKTPTARKTFRAVTRTGWVDSATYVEGQGVVDILFTITVTPHLTLLREKFTSYKLQQASALRSLYSWRLLELLTQFEKTGWREFEVDDFIKTLDLPETYQKNFGHIKKRVIGPAVKELKEKDGWLIAVNYKKAGRKVSRIRFDFERNPQTDLFA